MRYKIMFNEPPISGMNTRIGEIIPTISTNTIAIISNTIKVTIYEPHPILPIFVRIARRLNASTNFSEREKRIKAIGTMKKRIMPHTTQINAPMTEPPAAITQTLGFPDIKAKIASRIRIPAMIIIGNA